jgi:hypothetical protein
VTVISGSTAPLNLAPAYAQDLPLSRFEPSASATASEVQLTVANRNYLHQLAPICTKLRNLHQKIFCQKNKSGRGVPPLQAPSTLTPRLRFSCSKVGRGVPAEPLPSEPNLNDLPSLRFTWALAMDHAGLRQITPLKKMRRQPATLTPPLRFAPPER